MMMVCWQHELCFWPRQIWKIRNCLAVLASAKTYEVILKIFLRSRNRKIGLQDFFGAGADSITQAGVKLLEKLLIVNVMGG